MQLWNLQLRSHHEQGRQSPALLSLRFQHVQQLCHEERGNYWIVNRLYFFNKMIFLKYMFDLLFLCVQRFSLQRKNRPRCTFMFYVFWLSMSLRKAHRPRLLNVLNLKPCQDARERKHQIKKLVCSGYGKCDNIC